MPQQGRRCERKVVRRLHTSFSGSPEVGNGLDGELAQLVPQAGLTSAQTDAVIPTGTPVSSRSRSLKAEFRRRTTFHSCTPTSGQVSHTVWHTFAILRIKSRQTPLFEPGSATFYRTGYRFCARPILPITYRSIRRPGGPTHPPSRGTEGVCPLGGGRDSGGGWNGGSRRSVRAKREQKNPRGSSESRGSKNGGYLLSQLVGQYHRRW